MVRNTLTINAREQESVVDACDDYCMADIRSYTNQNCNDTHFRRMY